MNPFVFRMLAWCWAVVLMVGGCELKPLPGGLPGTGLPQDGVSQTIPFIVGQLLDGTGQPVEGASVRAYVAPYRVEGLSSAPVTSVETTTDAQGGFRLVSPPLGSVAVEARGRGQKALRTGVTVASGQTVEIGALSLQPTGAIAGRVTTPHAMDLLGTDVFIPGTDYLAKTASDGSYRLLDVPVGTYPLAAVRQSFQPRVLEGLLVQAGATTTAPDLQLSLDAPMVHSVTPESGGPGTVVTLRGENFGESKHTSFHVTFNDTLAVTARRLSDTEIQATVPVGASSGALVLRSNGIASQPHAFQVISRLSLSPGNVGLYPGASYAFGLQAVNDRGEAVPDPFVSWALRDPSLGTVSAQGVFQATGEGATELEVRSGVITAMTWVGVSRYQATTLYGTGESKAAGDGGPATQAAIEQPSALARDAQGNLYVAEGSVTIIRRISPEGTITHFAGNGQEGRSGDGGPAVAAGMGDFAQMAVANDRLWVSDSWSHVIRFIPLVDSGPWRAGYIYGAAGTGIAGYSGTGLPGELSSLSEPRALCARQEGLYFTDTDNYRIRRLTPDGRVLDELGTGLKGLMTAAVPAAAAALDRPAGLTFDAAGNAMIRCANQLVFWCRVAGTYFGRPMQAGTVYPLLLIDANQVFHGDGPLSQVRLHTVPRSLAFDAAGACWFVERQLVRRLTPQGRLETVAGKPQEAAFSRFLGYDGTGLNALRFSLAEANDLLMLGDRVLVADSAYHRLHLLTPMAP